jgi:CDP-diacylglycerol pyrophosphatase
MKHLLALLALALASAAAGPAQAANPDALWHIIHDRCVPDYESHANPAPCAAVVLPQGEPSGWVLLKDLEGVAQYLLMPTQKITGIEDPAILAPGEPNFFAEAWKARDLTAAKLGHPLPRDATSLAINAPGGRSQNQLHIHIDCLRTDVRATLDGALAGFGPTPTTITLAGHPYRATRLDGPDLTDNPFLLLARNPDIGAAELGRHTIVVVGETYPDGRDGFVMLDAKVDPMVGQRGNGEELQDHACAVAK